MVTATIASSQISKRLLQQVKGYVEGEFVKNAYRVQLLWFVLY